jgi:gliding motility-associated-like protein
VEADILTRAELPTAFSPNGDGNNDRFYVRGGGIEKSDLKIFNRWGQLVFESVDAPANEEAYGWDGTYKGKDQEMEVYAYVLNVTYIDGTTAQRKGNVTLLR